MLLLINTWGTCFCHQSPEIYYRILSTGDFLIWSPYLLLTLWNDCLFFQKLEQLSAIERRVDETRVDADELIDELIKQTDFQIDEKAESKWYS